MGEFDPPSPTERSPNKRPRFHRNRKVRRHDASGSWTCSIGKQPNRDRTRLRPKDWYFHTTEDEAKKHANRLQRDWEFLVKHWQRLYAPTLRIIDAPFAEVPHWQPSMSNRPEPTAEQVEVQSNRSGDAEDLVRAYASVPLRGVFSLFENHQKMCVAQGDIQQSTLDSLLKSLRSVLTYFPDDLRMSELTHGQIREAKSKMLEKLNRRTTKNRVMDLRRMLKWFYDSDFGQGHVRPTHFEEVFVVRNAVRADVKPYGTALLKPLLLRANDRERLYIMLALNCGMYQSDIGRLTLDEINVDDGYVFWDREKEPLNPFNVRHDLWPETLKLARQFVQPTGNQKRFNTDHRNGRAEQIDCSTLAFVDTAGNLLYRITPSGKAYDKIGKAFERLNTRLEKNDPKTHHYKFNHLRKSTNQFIREAVGRQIALEKAQLVSIEEISQMFLAQREGLLARLYSQTREISSATVIYGAMNQFLATVGAEMRKAGVFDCLS